MAPLPIKRPPAITVTPEPPLIRIKHPGYAGENTIFWLPAVDAIDDVSGLDFTTIMIACGIIAVNRFDGFLSTTSEVSSRPVPYGKGDLLPAGTYYFHVPHTEEQAAGVQSRPYPVVASFNDWTFPHGRIPEIWQYLNDPSRCASFAQVAGRCVVTAGGMTHQAHVVPQMYADWFFRNEMDQYANSGTKRGKDAIDDAKNLIRLRDDVHRAWDNNVFALVPKTDAAGQIHLVAHFMNAAIDKLPGIQNQSTYTEAFSGRGELFFARWVWQLLEIVRPFLEQSRRDRTVVVSNESFGYDTVTLDPGHLKQLFPKPRSNSPRKRRSPEKSDTGGSSVPPTPDLMEDDVLSSSPDRFQYAARSFVEEEETDFFWDQEQLTRGRKRRRDGSHGHHITCV